MAPAQETSLEWLREDIKALSLKVDRLLERPAHPAPCPELRALLEETRAARRSWRRLGMEVGKTAIIAAVAVLLLLWKKGELP